MGELLGPRTTRTTFDAAALDIDEGWVVGYAPGARGAAAVLWAPDGSVRDVAGLAPELLGADAGTLCRSSASTRADRSRARSVTREGRAPCCSRRSSRGARPTARSACVALSAADAVSAWAEPAVPGGRILRCTVGRASGLPAGCGWPPGADAPDARATTSREPSRTR